MALGNGDGTFQAPVSIVANPGNGGYDWIAAGDVNNDGWTDLVLTRSQTSRPALFVLVNNHQGGFFQNRILNNDGPRWVTLSDFNRDGNLDALVTMYYGSYKAAVYLGNGHGGFTLKGTLPFAASYYNPAQAADINGDGIPDALLPADGSLEIFVGKGDGTFYTPFDIGTGPGAGQILTQNLHGQPATAGLPDIVAPDSSGGVRVLINLTR
jgi:hypothetical protein